MRPPSFPILFYDFGKDTWAARELDRLRCHPERSEGSGGRQREPPPRSLAALGMTDHQLGMTDHQKVGIGSPVIGSLPGPGSPVFPSTRSPDGDSRMSTTLFFDSQHPD